MPDPVHHDPLPTRLGNLRFRHFQLIDLLVRLGTVRKAAQAMNLTQPAASLMVRDLETAFGVPLFERSPKGMVATAHGSAILDRARTMVGELRLAADQTGEAAGDATQMLCVGALPRVMLDLMPRVVRRAHEEWPELRLRFVEGVASQLLPALRTGEVDCIVARLTHEVVASSGSDEFHQQKLYAEGMSFVCGLNHPCARKRRMDIGDLVDADWVLPPPETEARQVFTNTFLRAGFAPPAPRIESLSVVSSMSLVQQAPYLTVAPAAIAGEWQKLGQLRVLPVTVDMSLSPIAFLCRRSNLTSAAVQRFGKLVGDCATVLRRPLSGKPRANSAIR
ncbi:MAG: LysR substrate-binding domain-containing protein [Burkholderiales bacterium]